MQTDALTPAQPATTTMHSTGRITAAAHQLLPVHWRGADCTSLPPPPAAALRSCLLLPGADAEAVQDVASRVSRSMRSTLTGYIKLSYVSLTCYLAPIKRLSDSESA